MVFAMALGWLLGAGAVAISTALVPRELLAAGLGMAIFLAFVLLRFRTQFPADASAGRDRSDIHTLGIRAMVFMMCAMVAFAITTEWARDRLRSQLSDELDGALLVLDVTIGDLPTRHARGWRFEVNVNAASRWAHGRQEAVSFPRRGMMNWTLDPERFADGLTPWPRLRPGQRWEFQARVRRPVGTLNPVGFDYEAWAFQKGVQFHASVSQSKRSIEPRYLGEENGFQIGVDRLRDSIRQSIGWAMPDSAAATVLSALVVGDQRAISGEDWALFQKTGVSHLMSISGLHVTMFAALSAGLAAMLMRLLCRYVFDVALRVPIQSVSALFATTGAFAYAVLAGFEIPAQRTTLMVTVMSFARILGWRASPWAVISLALIAVLIMDPLACLSPGFWLSFIAVALLFGATERASAQTADLSEKRPGWLARLSGFLKQAGAAQMAITLGLLPITVFFFQQIVLIGPVTNAVAIPVVSFLVTPLAMIGSVFATLTGWAAPLHLAGDIYLRLYEFLASCASFSWATLDWPAPDYWRVVLACAGVAIALNRHLPGAIARYRHLGWCFLFLLWTSKAEPLAHGELEVTFLDVGQGSGVLIRTAHHAVLTDAGPAFGDSDSGMRVVVPALRSLGIRSLDRMVISHFDLDHWGGAESVAAAIHIKEWMAPHTLPSDSEESDEPGHPFAEHRTRRLRALEFSQCRRGVQWVYDGVSFEFVHPQGDVNPDQKPRDRNSNSCVLRIASQAGGGVLLGGDLSSKEERMLAMGEDINPITPKKTGRKKTKKERTGEASVGLAVVRPPATLASPLLLLNHHGSKTSSSPEFLSAVNPKAVVIQAGYRNRYGHPHREVLERIAYPVYRTDLLGQIRFRWALGRPEPVVSDFWSTHRRFWHRPRTG